MMYEIAGWASTNSRDLAGHVMAQNAFKDSVRRKGLTGPKGIRLLAFHDNHKPIGRITKLESRVKGLWMEAEIDDRISYAKDLIAAIESAEGLNFSVGFFIEDADVINDTLVITKAELSEVSVVLFPANAESEITHYQNKTNPLARIQQQVANMKEIFA